MLEKDTAILIKLTKKEKKLIQTAAGSTNRSVSDYIRGAVFKTIPEYKEYKILELSKRLEELKKEGE